MVESASRPNIRPLHSAVTPSSSFVAYAETLEYDTQHALEFIATDECVEVTPKTIRLRKVHLDPQDRHRAAKQLASTNS